MFVPKLGHFCGVEDWICRVDGWRRMTRSTHGITQILGHVRHPPSQETMGFVLPGSHQWFPYWDSSLRIRTDDPKAMGVHVPTVGLICSWLCEQPCYVRVGMGGFMRTWETELGGVLERNDPADTLREIQTTVLRMGVAIFTHLTSESVPRKPWILRWFVTTKKWWWVCWNV